MRLHASNFGIQFLSHNIKIFNSYKPFSKLENRVFILKIFDAEESIVPPPIRDRIILRDNKQHSNSFEIELRRMFLKNLNRSNRDSLNFMICDTGLQINSSFSRKEQSCSYTLFNK